MNWKRKAYIVAGMVGLGWFLVTPGRVMAEEGGWWAGAWDYIRGAIIEGLVYVRDAFWSVTEPMATQVLEALPDVWGMVDGPNLWSQVGPYIATADHWFPITEMFVLLAAYWTAITGMALVKWALKAAPFVGG